MEDSLRKAICKHLGLEFGAYYEYLAMSCWLENQHYPGFAAYMKKKSEEEAPHAHKMIQHLLDRHQKVDLPAIDAPKNNFKSLADVFERVYKMEKEVTQSINSLYDLAEETKDRPVQNMLDWYIDEQVEEEKTARESLARLKIAGQDHAALLRVDHELQAGEVPSLG